MCEETAKRFLDEVISLLIEERDRSASQEDTWRRDATIHGEHSRQDHLNMANNCSIAGRAYAETLADIFEAQQTETTSLEVIQEALDKSQTREVVALGEALYNEMYIRSAYYSARNQLHYAKSRIEDLSLLTA